VADIVLEGYKKSSETEGKEASVYSGLR